MPPGSQLGTAKLMRHPCIGPRLNLNRDAATEDMRRAYSKAEQLVLNLQKPVKRIVRTDLYAR